MGRGGLHSRPEGHGSVPDHVWPVLRQGWLWSSPAKPTHATVSTERERQQQLPAATATTEPKQLIWLPTTGTVELVWLPTTSTVQLQWLPASTVQLKRVLPAKRLVKLRCLIRRLLTIERSLSTHRACLSILSRPPILCSFFFFFFVLAEDICLERNEETDLLR